MSVAIAGIYTGWVGSERASKIPRLALHSILDFVLKQGWDATNSVPDRNVNQILFVKYIGSNNFENGTRIKTSYKNTSAFMNLTGGPYVLV